MNHGAGRGAGHSLYGLDFGDDQLPERINVIGSNASDRVVRAGNNDGGGNAGDLPRLCGDLWRFLDVGLNKYEGFDNLSSSTLSPGLNGTPYQQRADCLERLT